ncbi:carbohydrate porin [Merismopedia glauca CCAP 1448/3]|uniref:Carbohydrate porin n=2 Tax=Merismopedia TaxID=53402 RepID=A0A2T1CA34_9CYAN|nr:carbohydrate porin [Merismopedia glauca CCAP 1448/3]
MAIALFLWLSNSFPASASVSKDDLMFQIPSVSEFSDVHPHDWEFTALKSLVKQYECGGDRFYRMLTRSEFAVKFHACWQEMQHLGAGIDGDTLTTIQRLRSDFAAELSALPRQIKQVETRVDSLENQQFSPRVELEGEVIFAPIATSGGKKADGSGESIDKSVFLGNGASFNFKTSFTGKDSLKISLESTQIPELEELTGTRMSNLGFDGDDEGQLVLDEVEYQFPLSERTRVTINSEGGGLGDYVPTVSPWLSGSEDGSISTFGKENPIRRQGSGAGIGISYKFSDAVNLSIGYVAAKPNKPEGGLFSTPNAAIAQLTLNPSKSIALSLTYTNSHNSFRTGTGSELTNNPFNDTSEAIAATGYGAEATVSLTPKFHIGGRIGYLQAIAEDLSDRPQANIFTWSAFLALEDEGKKGNLFGLIFGQPPKVVNNNFGADFQDRDTSLHLEAFYRWQINRNVGITPGIFLITNPEHNRNNDSIFVGSVRTTFTF